MDEMEELRRIADQRQTADVIRSWRLELVDQLVALKNALDDHGFSLSIIQKMAALCVRIDALDDAVERSGQ